MSHTAAATASVFSVVFTPAFDASVDAAITSVAIASADVYMPEPEGATDGQSFSRRARAMRLYLLLEEQLIFAYLELLLEEAPLMLEPLLVRVIEMEVQT